MPENDMRTCTRLKRMGESGGIRADASQKAQLASPNGHEAVADVLNFLADDKHDEFAHWYARHEHLLVSGFTLWGYPVPVLEYANWRLLPDEALRVLGTDHRARVESRLQASRSERQDHLILSGEDLLVFHDKTGDASVGFVVVLSPEAVERFTAAQFPNAKLTPALVRLLICFLGGMSLTEGARHDDKSVETRKSQSRELRQRLGLERTSDIMRVVGARLVATISAELTEQTTSRSETFDRYVADYLPDDVRSVVLLDRDHRAFRVLDMGPQSGKPLLVLHAMILPDIRKQDIGMLHELGLRLVWPLRNGLNSPEDPVLSEDEQIRHACRGIDLVRELFCEERISILSFAASSKVALEYARQNRPYVDALYFAAACVLEGRPQGGVRRLAKGMLKLASFSEPLMSATMEYFQRTILSRQSFPKFIRKQFQDSTADSRIVEAELNNRFSGERFREALTTSVTSARHDFGFQRTLNWEVAKQLGIELHFLHGNDDPIHPLPLIETLAASLPGARLHVIEDAGQLLYHDHLRAVLAPVANRLCA